MSTPCPFCKQPVVADFGVLNAFRPHNVGKAFSRRECRGSRKTPTKERAS